MFQETVFEEAVEQYLKGNEDVYVFERACDKNRNYEFRPIEEYPLNVLRNLGKEAAGFLVNFPQEDKGKKEEVRKEAEVLKTVRSKEDKVRRGRKKTRQELVGELREQGLSNQEIAEQLGVTVKKVTSSYANYKARKRRNPEAEAEEEAEKLANLDMGKVQALFGAGWSMEKVADEFGVSPEAMKAELNRIREAGETGRKEEKEA